MGSQGELEATTKGIRGHNRDGGYAELAKNVEGRAERLKEEICSEKDM